MSKLIIYEMDMTGGTCGFPAPIPGQAPANKMRDELIRRSRVTKEVKIKFNIEVDRILLKSVSYLKNEMVKEILKNEGMSGLPIFLLDDKIIHSGSFPDFEILQDKIRSAIA